jgi:type II secretory ATPase GspE/PulE/Tfp pilus assembly ATPase PilB-like protein
MPGVQQSQIDYSKGYDYETGLKAVLRHDPDIILVGETRSQETAEIAINAALTGHLVFTTLHTNSAIASIGRLISMEVRPYLLAPALQLIA